MTINIPSLTAEQNARLTQFLTRRSSMQPHQVCSVLKVTPADAAILLLGLAESGVGKLYEIVRCDMCGDDDFQVHPAFRAPDDDGVTRCMGCESARVSVTDLYFVPTRPTATTTETP